MGWVKYYRDAQLVHCVVPTAIIPRGVVPTAGAVSDVPETSVVPIAVALTNARVVMIPTVVVPPLQAHQECIRTITQVMCSWHTDPDPMG